MTILVAQAAGTELGLRRDQRTAKTARAARTARPCLPTFILAVFAVFGVFDDLCRPVTFSRHQATEGK
jgi:hypothetical protein